MLAPALSRCGSGVWVAPRGRACARRDRTGGGAFALCGLTVVGWCDIVRLYFHPGYEHNGRLGIGVLAAWRGQGLGRALLDHALSAASGTGFRRVELEVYASNTAALSLNKICGFTVEGLKRAMRLFDGRVEDVVLMACSLTDGFPEPLLHG